MDTLDQQMKRNDVVRSMEEHCNNNSVRLLWICLETGMSRTFYVVATKEVNVIYICLHCETKSL